ncbi:MAG: DUF4097 family beta strand repeat protein [Candidatus Eisenbacteria bacterium]|nr:DUF4097 family beta strand repeat protein [Candidatus Eisenbacteria bacterium]
MKRSHLLIAAAVLAIAPIRALADGDVWREQSQKVLEAADLGNVRVLRVENARGLIQVRPSPDGRVRLTALKLTRASDREHAGEFSRATRVETGIEGDRYVVRVRYPQRQEVRVSFWRVFCGDFELPVVEVRLSVEVPERMAVSLSSVSGDLETSGLAAPQRLRTTSGDLQVRDARGPLDAGTVSGEVGADGMTGARLRSVSGDISVRRARGPLDVRTTSGDIELRGVTDSVSVGSVSGDIRLDAAPRGLDASSTSGGITVEGEAGGLVRVNSTSGDVTLGLLPAVRRAEVTTLSGSIRLRLPESLGCTLDLRTSSGTLDTTVPLQVRTASRHSMTGVVHGGGVPVMLRTTSGDVVVTSGGK